jgi:serine/threonine protein kinase
MILKVGNTIGDCLKCFFIFSFVFVVRLDAAVGFSGCGKVFKVTNIKTKEIKALKAIPILDSSRSENTEEFKIGMEIGRKCEYLVHYDKIFVEGNFEIIIMDYFKKGDLQSYLNKGNTLNESVCTYFSCFILFFFLSTGNNKSGISDVQSDRNLT